MNRRLATLFTLIVLLSSVTSFIAPASAAQTLPYTANTRMGQGSIAEIAPATVKPRTGLFAHSGSSSVDPFPKNDITYPQDTGLYYDQYRNRTNLTNGQMTYDFTIDRYFSPLMAQVDSNGFLVNPQEVIARYILPPTGRLTMQVYDIDNDNAACPEVDPIWINGRQLFDSFGNPAVLTSGNDTWSTVSFEVPISMLKFPTAPGSGGAKPSKTNTITIRVNALNCTAAIPGATE